MSTPDKSYFPSMHNRKLILETCHCLYWQLVLPLLLATAEWQYTFEPCLPHFLLSHALNTQKILSLLQEIQKNSVINCKRPNRLAHWNNQLGFVNTKLILYTDKKCLHLLMLNLLIFQPSDFIWIQLLNRNH